MNGMDVDGGSESNDEDGEEEEAHESKQKKLKTKSKGKISESSNSTVGDNFTPMAPAGSIGALRAKLHARMEELRAKKGPKTNRQAYANASSTGSTANSKDELLEERRLQRAAMRERRRKETKEKKRREEEERGKKGKGKEKERQSTTTGTTTKVCLYNYFSRSSCRLENLSNGIPPIFL